LLLELVEQADERPPVIAEGVRDLRLRLRSALVEEGEDREVVRVEPDPLVLVDVALLRGEAEALEQEEVRSHQLGRQVRSRLCIDLGVRAHLSEYGSAFKRSFRV